MSFDTIIKNGTVVDGSGLPKRVADVGIKDGVITDIGRLSGAKETIDADGLVVMPGIVDAHTHYDPQVTFEGHATSSCYHGVTSVIAGNCGYSIAPCRPGDRQWVVKLFAQVEGMTPSVLEQGLPWDWESFPQLLDVLDERLGINVGIYVGHSAIRRFVMGDAASEREATDAEIQQMAKLVREAMRAGAAGFTSSKSPTHVDHLKRPVPSRKASFQEIKTLAAAAGEGGAGSIGYLAETAVQGYTAEDRQRIVELALASGLPVVVQGMGYRPGAKERWDDQVGFLNDARSKGAAVYSMLRTQPFMRPFNWNRGTSLFEGCYSWRELGDMTPAQRVAAFADAGFRKKLAADWDAPNTDSKRGSTLPPPRQTQVFVDKSASNRAAEGKNLAELAKAKGVHPVEVMCDLVVADKGETQFVYNSEGSEWIAANGESQRNPHMIVGTGDGGAHADRDDGAEWSTYFLRSWVLDRGHYTLEEGVRRITLLPAMICGIPLRGLLARGYHADVMLFDPQRLRLGKKGLINDMPGGEARWQVKPEGVVRVLVNGKTIVKDGELEPGTPGRVLRIGNAS
jgi:N-acyl-D-aspartate/D-glutamate deacylase